MVERVREELGLNLPLYEQFVIYVKDVLEGNFGNSVLTTNPVMTGHKAGLPRHDGACHVRHAHRRGFRCAAGCVGGGQTRQHHRPDRPRHRTDRLFGPDLLAGNDLALLVFYAKLGWTSGPGRIDVVYEYTFTPITGFYLLDAVLQQNWEAFRNIFSFIILPASLLGYFSLAYISRMTRSFMLNELEQEYIVAARAKGLSETRIIWGHALRNAAVPLVTVIALSYAGLLEGSVLTETVFSWPGLGLYITNSLQNADMNAVLGGTIIIGTVFVAINLLSDLLYRALDPRTRAR